MDKLFQKTSSILITNYNFYWNNPIINKYLGMGAIPDYEGVLILRKKGKNVWISHPFNYNQAKKEFGKKVIVRQYEKSGDFEKIVKKYCGKKVGYDATFTSVSGLANLKKLAKGKQFIDVSKEILKSREVKTTEEVEKISKAVRETKKVLVKAKRKLKKGISEKEIASFIQKEFEKNGFRTAFCIIAFGNNAKNLHHNPSNTKLSKGPVLFDVGANYKGYCADISESFWFGKKNIKYEAEKKKVEIALTKIKEKLRPGVSAKELWRVARDLGAPHSWGHGIGVEEHDPPIGIGEGSKWKLKEGMVLAIEPAVYDKFGIRIERDYLITKKGFKEL